jgi:pilus assembly protein CpaB
MRRGRIFIYIGLILILGLVAAVLLLQGVLNPSVPTDIGAGDIIQVTQEPTNLIDTVVVNQSILRGQEISEGMVEIRQIPEEQVQDGMFTDVEEVIGRIARYDLISDLPLQEAHLAFTPDELGSSGSDAALLIPSGMVAVSVPMDRLSGVSYGLRRGDSVNVIVTMLFVDLDSDFQSVLPNNTSAVIAPGPAIVVTQDRAAQQGGEPGDVASQISVDELLQTLTAQVVTGGFISPKGRLELDPTLGQPFYVVASESQRPRLVSQTLIQGAMVLQMGTFSLEGINVEVDQQIADQEAAAEQAQAAQADQGAEGDGGGAAVSAEPVQHVNPDIITLVVSPQDAVTLNYVLHGGARLSLAMRSAHDDNSPIQTEAVTLRFLLDQYNLRVPAKQPFGLEPRIDVLVAPVLLNDIIPPQPEQ